MVTLALGTITGAFATTNGGSEGDSENPTDIRYVAAIRFNNVALPDYYDLVAAEEGTLFLPAEEIFRAGEAVAVAQATRLELTVASTENSLILDHQLEEMEINGEHRKLTEDDFRLVDGKFLLSDKILSKVFQLQTTFNPSTQELFVKSGRPFPRDLRIARERLWDSMGNTDLKVPVHLQAQDYSLFGSPQADIALSSQYNKDSDPTGSWSALVVSEALYLTHHINAGGDFDQPFQHVSLRSGRMSPTGNVFNIGPLYDAQIGDISGLRMPLVGNGGNGRGLVLQASPLGRAKNFDKTLIEGDAPPGWDAELYLGTHLLNFQRVGADGRYTFNDVPLDYGSNNLKVVLYGPQGQIREELFSEQIGGAMVPPGEVQGSAYGMQKSLKLFPDDTSSETIHDSPWIGGAKIDIGVLQHLTVGLFSARSATDEERVTAALEDKAATTATNDYYGVELRPSLGSFVLETGGVSREQGGYAAYSRFAMPLYSLSLSAGYQYYDQTYMSQDNENGKVSGRTALRLGIPLGPKELQLGSMGVSFEDLQRWSSEPERKASLTYGHRLGPLFLGHQADINWRGEDIDMEAATGLYTLRSSYSIDLFDFRAAMLYGLSDESSLQTINFTGLWRRDNANRLYSTVSYSPETDKTSYGIGVSRDFGLAALSINGSVGDGQYACGLGLSFSFGHTPARGLNMSSRSRAMMGLADVHIFEDLDADGEFTPTRDKEAQGAGLLVNRRPLDSSSDSCGRIGLDSLSINDAMEVAVNTDTLSDGFLVPVYTAVQAWPRPGKAVEIKIPVTEAGEISGTAKISVKIESKASRKSGLGSKGKNDDNRQELVSQKIVERPLSGIRLQAVNAAGQLHAEVFTFSDGYFLFDTVYPGNWTVRVAPDQDYRGIPLTPVILNVELSAQQRVAGNLKINYQNDGKEMPPLADASPLAVLENNSVIASTDSSDKSQRPLEKTNFLNKMLLSDTIITTQLKPKDMADQETVGNNDGIAKDFGIVLLEIPYAEWLSGRLHKG